MKPTLFVAWRSTTPKNERWGPVGRLELDGNIYRFVYTRGAQTLEGFQPFSGMPDLETIYESEQLFPLFANRLLSEKRPEYKAYLEWGGFDPNHPPDPIALLGVTEGRRATDAFEVFPKPNQDSRGFYLTRFFLHGIRQMDSNVQNRIASLEPGNTLCLMLDIMNSYDPDAVAVRTDGKHSRQMIGYVPRYLASDIRQLCLSQDQDLIRLEVEKVNAKAPVQNRLLCQMTAKWPDHFDPCGGKEFQPLIGLPSVSIQVGNGHD